MPISSPAGTHRFNIAPTEEVLAIVAPKGGGSEIGQQARLLRWGLVPTWAEDLKTSDRRGFHLILIAAASDEKLK